MEFPKFKPIDPSSFYGPVGSVSAGVLGYISGGVKGAKKSIGAFNSYQNSMKRKASDTIVVVPNKKRKSSSTKKLVKRAVKKALKKATKKSSRKSKTARKESRALNSRIREVAIKAIHGEEPTGKYVKTVMYHLPNSIGGSNYMTQTVVNTGLYEGATTHDGQFCVGTYSKLIDALSILWSTKAAAFYTSTGDLSSAGMIVPYIKHRATYEFVNNTLVTQVLLCYACCTKEDTNASVYSNWANMSVVQKGGTTRGITFAGMRPEFYPQFREQYTYEKKEYRLLPGARIIIALDTGSKTHLDFDKWAPIGGGTPYTYRKNYTKELLIINWNAVTVGYGASATDRPAIVNQVTGEAGYTIGVQMTDVITCKLPENISTTENKNNTLCVWNHYDQNIGAGDSNTIITPAINEVNPAQ